MTAQTTVAGSEANREVGGKRTGALIGSYVALVAFVVMFLTPPFYTILTSFKSSSEISSQAGSPWLVRNPTLENFLFLVNDRNFQIFFWNSTKVTICVVALSLLISVPAAFAIARIRFRGSELLANGIFLTYLVPASLLFIPLFQIIGALGLINNVWAMVLIYPTLSVPFCTWILIGYFGSIPRELDEAALIDGASYLQLLIKIFIPISTPGLVAATIFAFTVSWGQFLYPMAYLYTSDQMMLTVGITSDLIRGDVFQWGRIMAACVLAALPPIVIYTFLMDYYVAGLTAGATKG